MAKWKAKVTRATTIAQLRKLNDQIPRLLLDWYRAQEPPLQIHPDRAVFLDDISLQRQADGTVSLTLSEGQGEPRRFQDVQLRNLSSWLLSATKRKAIGIVEAECQKRFGYIKLKYGDAQWIKLQAALYSACLLGGDHIRQQWIQRVEKAFTELLDPEALRLARLIRGTCTTLATYNRIALDLGMWQLLEKQAPGLLPLIGVACRKDFIPFDANAFRSLKQRLVQYGLREAGWKTLCRMSIEQIRWLTENLTFEQCASVANHYADAGVIPEDELLTNSYAFSNLLGLHRLLADPPMQSALAWFDGAASRELARLKQANNPLAQYFMQNEYQLAADWLRDYTAHGGIPDTHQKKAGWQWIKRQSDAWHEAQIKLRTTTNLTWASAVDVYQDAGYEVVPLTSSADLELEGWKMHHCVGSYALQCYQGYSRIFSIRMNGARLATAELVRQGRFWALNQNRGPCNSPPSLEVMEVANRLLERYNEASKTI